MTRPYARRVSSEEAREGYLLVEKVRLSFFPPEGQHFVLRGDGGEQSAVVESYACSCRGPEKPHRHWLLRIPGLERGATATITPENGAYRLTLASA